MPLGRRVLLLTSLATAAFTRQLSQQRVISRLGVDSATEAANVISDAFPLSSPHSWGRALGIDGNNMAPFMTGYLQKQLAEDSPPSFGLVEEGEGLLGAIICERKSWKKEKAEESPAQDYSPYLAIEGLLSACDDKWYRAVGANPRLARLASLSPYYGYIAWMATAEQHRGKGIAYDLVEHATAALAQQALGVAVAYTVSPAASRVFERCGYLKVDEVVYAEWEMCGRRPFSVLPDEVSIMVKEL